MRRSKGKSTVTYQCLQSHASPDSPPPAKLDAPTLEKILATQRERDEDIDRRLRAPRLPTSLPPEDDAMVDDLLSKRGVVSKCGALQIDHKDIARLTPNTWLNDEIVNFYGQLIMNRAEAIKRKAGTNGKKKPLEIYYFNTFFWQKISKQSYEDSRLDRWTKKVCSCTSHTRLLSSISSLTYLRKTSFSSPSTITIRTGQLQLSTSAANG